MIVRLLLVLVAMALVVALWFPGLIRDPDYIIVENDLPNPPSGARDVLFVGNSYLFAHQVPLIVQRLVPDAAPPLAFDALLSSGKHLSWHVDRGDVAKRTREREFDTIVIQPHALDLLETPAEAKRQAKQLAEQASEAKPILLQTWPRHPERDEVAARVGSMTKWNAKVRRNARAVGFQVAPVGDVWLCVHDETGIDLWTADGDHASIEGAYVTALVLHHAIHGDEAAWSGYVPPRLGSDEARTLREVVEHCLDGRQMG